jgi:hypothetical protein
MHGQQNIKNFDLLLNYSKTAPKTDHPLIQWTLEAISQGIKRTKREADHSLLVPRLRMRGFKGPLPIRLQGV